MQYLEIILWIIVGFTLGQIYNWMIQFHNDNVDYKNMRKSVDEILGKLDNNEEPYNNRIHTYYEIPYTQFKEMYEKRWTSENCFELFGDYVLFTEDINRNMKPEDRIYTLFYFTRNTYKEYHEFYLKKKSDLIYVNDYFNKEVKEDNDKSGVFKI